MKQSLLLLVAAAFCLQTFTSLNTVHAASESDSDSESNSASNSESDESSKYQVHITETKEDEACVTKYVVKGELIDDTFTRDCYDDELEVVIDDDNQILIVGNLKAKPFTLYSNKPDTLTIIEDGKCTRKLYGGAKKKITSKPLTRSECREVKKSVSTELKKKKKEQKEKKPKTVINTAGTSNSFNNHGTGTQNFAGAVINSNGNYGSNSGFSTMTNRYEKKGKCQEIILVIGKDFDDMFSQECAEKGLSILQQKDSLVIGDPEKDPIALYSDSPDESSLIIIKKRKCTKRTYVDDDDKPYKDSEVKDSKCKEVMKKIKNDVEENRKYWEQWEKDFNKKFSKM